MGVGQPLGLHLYSEFEQRVQGDLVQLANGLFVDLDLGQIVLLLPGDGVLLGVGQRSAKIL